MKKKMVDLQDQMINLELGLVLNLQKEKLKLLKIVKKLVFQKLPYLLWIKVIIQVLVKI